MNEIAWNFYCETWHQCCFEDFCIIVNMTVEFQPWVSWIFFIFHQKWALFFSSGRVIMANFSLKKGFISYDFENLLCKTEYYNNVCYKYYNN